MLGDKCEKCYRAFISNNNVIHPWPPLYTRPAAGDLCISIMQFLFQGKPAVELDSPNHPSRRNRPQVTTRHLFAPTAVQQQQQLLSSRLPPQTATESIFAPRTEDMNTGFLTFSEDQPGLTSAYFLLSNRSYELSSRKARKDFKNLTSIFHRRPRTNKPSINFFVILITCYHLCARVVAGNFKNSKKKVKVLSSFPISI